jgi:hypothetical protein
MQEIHKSKQNIFNKKAEIILKHYAESPAFIKRPSDK